MAELKRITIVGVGALGSHVAQFLRNEGELHLVDFDRVEAKNALSQFYDKAGLGQLKVKALATKLMVGWQTKVTTNLNRVHRGNAEQALCVHPGIYPTLIIDCLDNGDSRRVVQDFAFRENIPLLHGAIDAAGTFGRVGWSGPIAGNKPPKMFPIDDEDKPGQATCENGEALPMLAIVSAFIARSAQRFLREGKFIGWNISPGGTIAT